MSFDIGNNSSRDCDGCGGGLGLLLGVGRDGGGLGGEALGVRRLDAGQDHERQGDGEQYAGHEPRYFLPVLHQPILAATC